MARIKLVLLFVCLLANTPVSAHWTSSCSTGLEYILSFGMIGFGIKNQASLQYFQDLPDASEKATHFVHDQFKAHGVPNYKTIKVKIGSNYGAIHDSLITLQQNEERAGKSDMDDILEASQNGETEEIRQDAQFSLGLFKAVLSHEIQHLLKQDLKNLIRAQFVIPVVTYISTRALEEGVKSLLPESVTRYEASPMVKNGFSIFKGLCRYVINSTLYLKLSRYQEQRADDSIPNDPKLLKDFREFLYLENDDRREQVRKNHGDHDAELFDTNRIYYEFKNFIMDSEHPSPLSRIKRIDERLSKLE